MLSRKIETIKGLIVGSCWLSLVTKYLFLGINCLSDEFITKGI